MHKNNFHTISILFLINAEEWLLQHFKIQIKEIIAADIAISSIKGKVFNCIYSIAYRHKLIRLYNQ